MSYSDPFDDRDGRAHVSSHSPYHQDRSQSRDPLDHAPIEFSNSHGQFRSSSFEQGSAYGSHEELSRYSGHQALEDEDSNEEIPLKNSAFADPTAVGGFKVESAGGPGYPPDIDPVQAFGFPVPSFTGHEGRPGDEAYSQATNLYRSQTSAEAWGKRQRINPNRAKTIKVKLQQGNFVHEYPVPSTLW